MLLYIKLYLQWSFVSIIDVFSLLYVRPRHVYWNLFVDSPWARVFLCLFSCVSPSFLSCVPLVSTWPLAPWVQGWVTFVHGYVSPEEMLGRGRFLGGAHERLGLVAEWGCCGFAPFTPGENTFWKSCSCRQEVGKHLVVLPVLTSRGTSLQCRCQVASLDGSPLTWTTLAPTVLRDKVPLPLLVSWPEPWPGYCVFLMPAWCMVMLTFSLSIFRSFMVYPWLWHTWHREAFLKSDLRIPYEYITAESSLSKTSLFPAPVKTIWSAWIIASFSRTPQILFHWLLLFPFSDVSSAANLIFLF